MKNNTLSALVIFFAVVACLLIIDDISYNRKQTNLNETEQKQNIQNQESNLATVDLATED